jgi:hypothetical protein
MATTATNKQPLLVDRVFHKAVSAMSLASGSATSLDIEGTNQSAVLVDCSANDGAVVEDLYVIARTSTSTAYTALFYLSSAVDYLRPTEGVYVGKLTSSTTTADKTSSADLPKVLAPLAHVGSNPQVRALYIPKGNVLWCTLQLAGSVNTTDTPIIAAQGGFY